MADFHKRLGDLDIKLTPWLIKGGPGSVGSVAYGEVSGFAPAAGGQRRRASVGAARESAERHLRAGGRVACV